MSTPGFTSLDVHANRDLVFPEHEFQHPLSDEQFAELQGLLTPALAFGPDKHPAWQAGHQQGLLMALILLERSADVGRVR